MTDVVYGFIGLGNMGRGMARNVAAAGHTLIVHDIAGTADRAPAGALIAQSNAEIARRAGVIALSLPTVAANRAVIAEIAEAGHAGRVIVDTGTIGPEAARENARILAAAGIDYVDSPVSGLKAKADDGTLASMTACTAEVLERARPLIDGYSRIIYHVGAEAGQGQLMKVVNNALFISALVTTSEALTHGEKGGLDMRTMLEVINASSGQNVATSTFFPSHVAGGTYDAGAVAKIIEKDLGLFVTGAAAGHSPHAVLAKAYEVVAAFSASNPAQDMARIYPFVGGRGPDG